MKIIVRFFKYLTLLFFISAPISCTNQHVSQNEVPGFRGIRGWNILSDDEENAYQVIDAAGEYNINHLQLSHHIVHNLREVKEEKKRVLCHKLITYAHKKGIPEVVIWDHALYPLSYYPDEFKTGPGGTIDLDNPDFWQWFRDDYRKMLDLIPQVDGIILTFIETGARAEKQHSVQLSTAADKLAKVIDEVAEVVITEKKLKLYARTFIYTRQELDNILKCIGKIKNEEVILMVKEVPHDFFLTHPTQSYIDQLKRPVLIEFDAGHEYNGQGVIANTFVEKTAERWRYYQQKPNVIGYVARTDRYGTTKIIDRPSEILLYTLYALTKDQATSDEEIYDGFITREYGKAALPYLKPAFKKAFDIVTSSLYTLGLCMANHSTLSCDYQSTYNRFVSGRWMINPVEQVAHGVNKTFHYYKDVVNHLAPKDLKEPGARLFVEDPFVADSAWVQAAELMTSGYLQDIIIEKDYGVTLAEEALQAIVKSEPFVTKPQYKDLYQTFYRTLVKAKLCRGAAKAYFAYRLWTANEENRDQHLLDIFWEGIDEMQNMAEIVKHEFGDSPQGQWTWENDLKTVENYINHMTKEGWKNYGGVVIANRGL